MIGSLRLSAVGGVLLAVLTVVVINTMDRGEIPAGQKLTASACSYNDCTDSTFPVCDSGDTCMFDTAGCSGYECCGDGNCNGNGTLIENETNCPADCTVTLDYCCFDTGTCSATPSGSCQPGTTTYSIEANCTSNCTADHCCDTGSFTCTHVTPGAPCVGGNVTYASSALCTAGCVECDDDSDCAADETCDANECVPLRYCCDDTTSPASCSITTFTVGVSDCGDVYSGISDTTGYISEAACEAAANDCDASCTSNSDCSSPTPYCDTDDNTCKECGDGETSECASNQTCWTNTCTDLEWCCVDTGGGTPGCQSPEPEAGCSWFGGDEYDSTAYTSEAACEAGSNPCGGCTSNSDCSSPTPYCDTGDNTCKECGPGEETECSGSESCQTNSCTPDIYCCNDGTFTCSATDNTAGSDCTTGGDSTEYSTSGACTTACVECTSNSDCSSPTPYCDTGDNTCKECGSGETSECTVNESCQTNTCTADIFCCDDGAFTCSQEDNTAGSDCTTGGDSTEYSTSGACTTACVECTVDGDCPANNSCQSNSCVPDIFCCNDTSFTCSQNDNTAGSDCTVGGNSTEYSSNSACTTACKECTVDGDCPTDHSCQSGSCVPDIFCCNTTSFTCGSASNTAGADCTAGSDSTEYSSSALCSSACTECTSDSDCPADVPSTCTDYSCVSGSCQATTCTADQVCDGAGTCVDCLSDSDCTADDPATCKDYSCNTTTNTCELATCSADEVCDGSGTCVDCLSDSDCDAFDPATCSGERCVANSCVDQSCTGGTVCDGVGNCVDRKYCCISDTCVFTTCSDGHSSISECLANCGDGCSDRSDCPADIPAECKMYACESAACVESTCDADEICDGAGNCRECINDSDCSPTYNALTCSGQKCISFSCVDQSCPTGEVCDGAGNCEECVSKSDCPADNPSTCTTYDCVSNSCVSTTCAADQACISGTCEDKKYCCNESTKTCSFDVCDDGYATMTVCTEWCGAECSERSDCPDDNPAECKTYTCDGGTCLEETCPDDKVCDGAGTCIDPPPPPVCRDGIINQPTEQCEVGKESLCPSNLVCRTRDCRCVPPQTCGDKLLNQPSEECEDTLTHLCPGDTVCNLNTCACEEPPACGDQQINQPTEECEVGIACPDIAYICKVDRCKCDKLPDAPECGNGIAEGAEQCDDGNTDNNDDCPDDCRFAVCGDEIKEGREECDDGNIASGDGCDEKCKIEGDGDDDDDDNDNDDNDNDDNDDDDNTNDGYCCTLSTSSCAVVEPEACTSPNRYFDPSIFPNPSLACSDYCSKKGNDDDDDNNDDDDDAPKPYACINNQCVEDASGTFGTIAQCQQSCGSANDDDDDDDNDDDDDGPKSFSCTNNQCIEDKNGPFTSQTACQAVCVIANDDDDDDDPACTIDADCGTPSEGPCVYESVSNSCRQAFSIPACRDGQCINPEQSRACEGCTIPEQECLTADDCGQDSCGECQHKRTGPCEQTCVRFACVDSLCVQEEEIKSCYIDDRCPIPDDDDDDDDNDDDNDTGNDDDDDNDDDDNDTPGNDDDDDDDNDDDLPDPIAVCGNGKPDTGEQCDDGNSITGDGCNAFCKVENCRLHRDCLVTGLCIDGICSGCSTDEHCPAGECVDGNCTPCTGDEQCTDSRCFKGACTQENVLRTNPETGEITAVAPTFTQGILPFNLRSAAVPTPVGPNAVSIATLAPQDQPQFVQRQGQIGTQVDTGIGGVFQQFNPLRAQVGISPYTSTQSQYYAQPQATPETGPGALVFILGGGAAGYAWMRRKR